MTLSTLSLLAFSVTSSASAKEIDLAWRGELPTVATDLACSLEVVDQRPAEEGADDPALLGKVRGGYGNPFQIVARHDGLQGTLAAWTTDVLGTQGIAVHPEASDCALTLVVDRFWTDGYFVNWMQIDLRLEVRDGDRTLWSQDLSGGTKQALWWGVWSAGALDRMANRVLDGMSADAVATVATQSFRASVAEQAAPVAASAF